MVNNLVFYLNLEKKIELGTILYHLAVLYTRYACGKRYAMWSSPFKGPNEFSIPSSPVPFTKSILGLKLKSI